MDILKTKDYETFYVGTKQIIGASKVSKALVGDTVEVVDDRVSNIVLRADHTHLVGTLEISGRTKYGYTSRNVPIYLFIPYNEAYPPFYVGSSHPEKSVNLIVIVDFDSWHADANCPRETGALGVFLATISPGRSHGVDWSPQFSSAQKSKIDA